MNAETFLEQFETFAEAPNGVEQLRAMILQLAVQGKLVPQDPNDEPASLMLARIKRAAIQSELWHPPKRLKNAALPTRDDYPYSIPENWTWVAVSDLGYTKTGTTPDRSVAENFGNDFPFIRPADIFPNRVNYEGEGLSREGAVVADRLAPAGSILMVCIGTIGKCNVIDRECSFNQQINSLTPYPELNSKLLTYFLRSESFQREAWARSSSTTISILNKGKWEAIPVPLPPLAEQKRIVAKVDQLLALCDELAARQEARRVARTQLVGATLDRLVSTRSAADLPPHVNRLRTHFDHLFDTPTTIPQLRQTILQLAVQGQLVPQDPNDEPVEPPVVHERRKKEKWVGPVSEQEVPCQLPTSWKWLRTGDVSVLKHGYAFSSRHFTNEPAPFVLTTPGNFYEKGGFRDRESKRKYYKGPVDPDFILNPGDFIIPMTEQAAGLLGSPAFIPDDGMVYVHNQRLGKLAFSEVIVPEYAFWYFNSDFFRGELARTCTGMKVRHTSPDRVLRVPFPVPPLAEQKRIVAKVTELLSLCDTLEAQLQTAESASSQLLSAAVHHLLST